MYKTLYIRKGDETFWERAEAEAKSKGSTLSKMLSDMLRVRTYRTGAGEEITRTPAEQLADAESTIARVRAELESES